MNVFEEFLSSSEVAALFDGSQFLAHMLRFEAELARAQAVLGIIPHTAIGPIVAACDLALYDVKSVVRESGAAGSIAIPLIKALRARVATADQAAATYVHFGSTSQDVIDTALALTVREALTHVHHDLDAIVNALHQHALAHAATPVLARTLMQPASVTSFGWKCLNWLAPIHRSRWALKDLEPYALQVQLGGAVGTLREQGAQGIALKRALGKALGLSTEHITALAWHTQRDSLLRLACELSLLTGSLGKVAQDIALMAQFEVGELAEPSGEGRGGSSAMPHKQNPVGAMVAITAAQRVPNIMATMLAAMPQAHERSLGGWQTELAQWPQLLSAVHGATMAMAIVLPGLRVNAARMRANLDALRAVVDTQTAVHWFDPAFATAQAEVVLAELNRFD